MKHNQTIAIVTTALAMVLARNAFARDAAPTEGAPPAPEVAPPPVPEVDSAPAPEVAPPPLTVPQPMGAPFNTADTGAPVAPPDHWEPASRSGISIMGGGGVTDFTQNTARDTTSTGGAWDVRMAFGTRRWLGFEGSYVGGANSLHNLGTNNSSTLVRNGVEGSVRLNLPLYVHDTLFEPYAAGGVGWNGYRVINYNAALSSGSISANSDNTVSVPLAVGFALGYKGFIADTRFTIRPTYNQTLLTQETGSALTNWDFGGMLGYEF